MERPCPQAHTRRDPAFDTTAEPQTGGAHRFAGWTAANHLRRSLRDGCARRQARQKERTLPRSSLIWARSRSP